MLLCDPNNPSTASRSPSPYTGEAYFCASLFFFASVKRVAKNPFPRHAALRRRGGPPSPLRGAKETAKPRGVPFRRALKERCSLKSFVKDLLGIPSRLPLHRRDNPLRVVYPFLTVYADLMSAYKQKNLTQGSAVHFPAQGKGKGDRRKGIAKQLLFVGGRGLLSQGVSSSRRAK